MSQLIITTDVSSIRPVFSEGTAENIKRYNQLKKLFENTKEYRIFAEPVAAGGQKIAWHTEYDGTIIPFRKLDEEDKETAKGLLKNEVNKVYKTIVNIIDEADNRERLFELIDSCLEIPDYDDIYIIQNANGEKNFCIVRWGFINEDFNAPKHLIAKLIPLKVASVKFKIIKGNNKIAKNEKVFFEINEKTHELTSDEKGIIFFNDIKLLTKISAYQLDDNGNKIYEQTYEVKSDSEFTFFIGNQSMPKQTVKIQILDENDNIIPKANVKIKYDEVEFTTEADEEGIIELGELFVDTKVKCSQIKNDKILKSLDFEVKQGKSIYFVNFLKQKTKGTVKIQVVDENNNPIGFAEIEVKFPDGQKKHYISDEEGFFEIKEAPYKTELIFRQIINKLPQFQQIISINENDKIIKFKGKQIKTPFEYTNLGVTVLTADDKPIQNLRVKVENGEKPYHKITNEQGYAYFENLECTQTIKLIVEYKNKKHTELIKCEDKETKKTIKLGKKIGLLWLWILLALLLIALLVIFLPKIKLPSNNNITPPQDTSQTTTDTTITPPVIKGMKFNIKDKDGNFIKDAEMSVTYNDTTYTGVSDTSGYIIFENLLDTGKIVTAVVSAPGYQEQRLTIKIAPEKTIVLSNQSVEISEVILPCGTQIESKGYHSTIQTFNMKKPQGKFLLLYDMFDIADKIIVYKGDAMHISNDKIIWQSNGFERKLHKIYVTYDSPDTLLTVEIQGGDTTRTEWYFKVNCPQ